MIWRFSSGFTLSCLKYIFLSKQCQHDKYVAKCINVKKQETWHTYNINENACVVHERVNCRKLRGTDDATAYETTSLNKYNYEQIYPDTQKLQSGNI